MPKRQQLLELSQYHPEQPVVSLYLKGNPQSFDRKHLIRLKNLLTEAEQQRFEYSDEVWEGIQEDLKSIDLWVRANYLSSSQNTAIFACGDELWRVFSPSSELPNHVTISKRPYLRPLYELLPRSEAYLVLLTDARYARILVVTPNGAIEVATEVAEKDSMIGERYDQGGWAQARIERHQAKMIAQHLQKVANLAFHLWQEQEFDGVLLMGTDERTSELADHLHTYLKNNLLGRLPMDMQAHQNEIAESTFAHVRRKRREEVNQQIDKWQAHLASDNGYGVAGLSNTLLAAQRRQLQTLLMRSNWHAPGGKCEQCYTLTEQEKGSCHYCNGKISHHPDITEVLIASALAQNATLIFLPADVESHVGAILKYAIK